MVRKLDNILDAVGRTPIVQLRKLAPPHANVKIEAFNPMAR